MTLIQWHVLSSTRRKYEEELVKSIPCFAHERTYVTKTNHLAAIGQLHYNAHRTGKEHHLRIRLEYPADFPRSAPHVFDHDHVLRTGNDGHLLHTHELCLTLAARGEFTLNSPTLTAEVLGAALVWFRKREIYNKNGDWPGQAERHGLYADIDLLVERGIITDEQTMTDWLMRHATTPSGQLTSPDRYAQCPCGSGKRVRFCHKDDLNQLFKRLDRIQNEHSLANVLGSKDGGATHESRP